MNKFYLRFYGRFVFADAGKDVPSKILAVDPQSVPSLGSDQHDLLMVASRSNVRYGGTTAPAAFVLVPAIGGLEPDELEQVAWTLENRAVTVPGQGGLGWQGDMKLLPDLKELTGGTARLNPAYRAKSVISIAGGSATPKVIEEKEFDFVALKAPQTPLANLEPRPLAEMIEIVVEAKDTLKLEIAPLDDGPAQAVEFKVGKRSDTAIIVFSHQCAGAHQLLHDQEFAAFYETLEAAPAVPDRIVPRPPMPFSEFPCVAPAYIKV